MELRITHEFIAHPYKDEPSSKNEAWAKIRLEVVDDFDKVIKTVFNIQWNAIEIIDWVNLNINYLMNDEIPNVIKGDSIAKGIFDFYESLDSILKSEGLVDTIYSYRTKHGIRFGLRGVEIDDVYIGVIDKVMTISFYSETDDWNYQVDIMPFLNGIRKMNSEIELSND